MYHFYLIDVIFSFDVSIAVVVVAFVDVGDVVVVSDVPV